MSIFCGTVKTASDTARERELTNIDFSTENFLPLPIFEPQTSRNNDGHSRPLDRRSAPDLKFICIKTDISELLIDVLALLKTRDATF